MSRRTGFTGSALIRLLARLTDTDVAESKQFFSDRLSQWLGWTDAISLSAALGSGAVSAPSKARAWAAVGQEEAECLRVRTALARTVADGTRGGAADTAQEFAHFRRRYLARQQAMEAGIAPLRARLRIALAAQSPDMARLATVDAVMEQALGPHERSQLATVPALLERHFKRLRQAHGSPDDDSGEPGSVAWQDIFDKDMQGVLLAELEIRFQPVEGLLEALRAT